MRYLSVCSGIEAATSAWHHLGWEPAAFAEIEPFPSAVLAHHYPGVPNVGDMTKFKEWQIGSIDLLVGGTPCQAFSVAGLRGGLSDARGNLSLTFCEIADHYDPEWILWENVPGVLSSKDNAFGCFLAGLSGAGEPLVSERGWDSAGLVAGPKRTVAWRVLDAQFNGVAQRRRRVFVLAVRGAGNWACARALFPIGEGVFWDSAPRRKAGQKPAPTIAGCANGGGANGPGRDVDSVESLQFGPVISPALKARDYKGPSSDGDGDGAPLIAHAFDARQSDVIQYGDKTGPLDTDGHSIGVMQPVGVTLHGTDGTQSVASFTDLSSSLRARIPSGVENSTTTAVMQPVAHVDTMPTMLNGANTEAGHNARSGHTKDQYIVPMAIGWDEELNASVEQAGTLLRGGDGGRHDGVAYTTKLHNTASNNAGKLFEERTTCLDANSPPPALLTAMQVRRLTPRECERLQGFPDDHTLIPWRGKPAAECPDGPRYKALGNSMAVPVMRWIGERVQLVSTHYI